MKKNFKFYIICWAVLLAAFNLICFILPGELTELSKSNGSFWIGYAFINIAFIGQLICANIAFKSENLKKFFYNIPLINTSYIGLALTVFFGVGCISAPMIPSWAGAITCIVILALTVVAVVKASASASIVAEVEENVNIKSQFIKNSIIDAKSILAGAKSDKVKAECKKVYEALRYSDPMSNPSLSVEEAQITIGLSELASAVGEDNCEKVSEIANKIVQAIKERNNKCKASK